MGNVEVTASEQTANYAVLTMTQRELDARIKKARQTAIKEVADCKTRKGRKKLTRKVLKARTKDAEAGIDKAKAAASAQPFTVRLRIAARIVIGIWK